MPVEIGLVLDNGVWLISAYRQLDGEITSATRETDPLDDKERALLALQKAEALSPAKLRTLVREKALKVAARYG